MKRELRLTADGSATLFVESLAEHYHSIHGAKQESNHVFIDAGLMDRAEMHINILEYGFGTGLNAVLTAQKAAELHKTIFYQGIEKYPITPTETEALGYDKILEPNGTDTLFNKIHKSAWEVDVHISAAFTMHKTKLDFANFLPKENFFHLIYFDAFAPGVQPDVWQPTIIEQCYNALQSGGIWVTYCAKGQLKRDLRAIGFVVEPLPGPPGKREMTRARKP